MKKYLQRNVKIANHILKISKMGLNSNIEIQINKDSSIKMARQCLLAKTFLNAIVLCFRETERGRDRHADWIKALEEEFKFHSSPKCTTWRKINFPELRGKLADQGKSHIIAGDVQFWHE